MSQLLARPPSPKHLRVSIYTYITFCVCKVIGGLMHVYFSMILSLRGRRLYVFGRTQEGTVAPFPSMKSYYVWKTQVQDYIYVYTVCICMCVYIFVYIQPNICAKVYLVNIIYVHRWLMLYPWFEREVAFYF